jgi:hypothetical protein
MVIGTWRWYQGARAQHGVNQSTYIHGRKGLEEEEYEEGEEVLKREECEVGGRLVECLGVLFSFCKHDSSK